MTTDDLAWVQSRLRNCTNARRQLRICAECLSVAEDTLLERLGYTSLDTFRAAHPQNKQPVCPPVERIYNPVPPEMMMESILYYYGGAPISTVRSMMGYTQTVTPEAIRHRVCNWKKKHPALAAGMPRKRPKPKKETKPMKMTYDEAGLPAYAYAKSPYTGAVVRIVRGERALFGIRTVANATIALEFDTTPQKYILGVTDEQYDVLISDKFKSYVGSLLAATSNPETGENPVFGQLAQGSLSPHTEKMRMTATQFAAATGLTVTDVGVVNDANPTSSDAILAQSQTLVLLAQQLNTGNGDALRTIAQMAQAILRNVPPGALTEEERNVMPHFKNPAMPSVAVTADAAIKIATAREEFASTDTFLEMIGFDQADIRRIRAQEQRVRGQQVLMEMEDENNDAGVGDVHPQAGAAE